MWEDDLPIFDEPLFFKQSQLNISPKKGVACDSWETKPSRRFIDVVFEDRPIQRRKGCNDGGVCDFHVEKWCPIFQAQREIWCEFRGETFQN